MFKRSQVRFEFSTLIIVCENSLLKLVTKWNLFIFIYGAQLSLAQGYIQSNGWIPRFKMYLHNPFTMDRLWDKVCFLKFCWAGLNSKFSFSSDSPLYYLPIAWRRKNKFMPFPRALVWRKIQTTSSRVWTWLTKPFLIIKVLLFGTSTKNQNIESLLFKILWNILPKKAWIHFSLQ